MRLRIDPRMFVSLLLASGLLLGCQPFAEEAEESADLATASPAAPPVPSYAFEPTMVFPADRSLLRPEDGVELADGRIIVADQQHGLRVFDDTGSHRPFGRFAEAGYEHSPPEIVGGPNGVTLVPGATHLLVADVFRGGLYRVEIASEATEKVYQHPFGINTARADSRGGVWFTQSTRNNPERGEEELFESVGVPNPDGALFYLPPGAAADGTAVLLAEGLNFTNGVVLDEERGLLYMSETMGSRVHRFEIDIEAGTVSNQTAAVEVDHPDNLELDRHGRLWIASPVRSEIVVFDPATGKKEPVFRISTPESEAQIEAIEARLTEGVSWLDLLTPPLYEPAPGPITGLILTSDGEGAAYLTGLGNALIDLTP